MLLFIAGFSANAQTFQTGTNVVSAGIGLGSSIAGYTYGSQSPGFSLQFERGIRQTGTGVISVGGYLGFKNCKGRNPLSYSAGASNASGSCGSSGGSYGSAVGFTAFAGGRYFFAKNPGVYGELGYEVSYINQGLALKFQTEIRSFYKYRAYRVRSISFIKELIANWSATGWLLNGMVGR